MSEAYMMGGRPSARPAPLTIHHQPRPQEQRPVCFASSMSLPGAGARGNGHFLPGRAGHRGVRVAGARRADGV